jgi:hypothetical protein
MRAALLSSIAVCAVFFACAVPTVVRQNGREYDVVPWDGGTFVYVTYEWHGGRFDDAVELERDFVAWGTKQGLVRTAVGRFPTSRRWQLGFIASRVPAEATFAGHAIDTATIENGLYASLKAEGHPQNMFFHWKRLKKRLLKDGHRIDSPVFEIYHDLLLDSVDVKTATGEIRYRLAS